MALRLSFLVALCLLALAACATESSPADSLGAIRDHQETMEGLDERAASFDFESSSALDEASELAGDYDDLVSEARSDRPEGISGAEDDLWEAFLAILEQRAQGGDALVQGVQSGDLAAMQSQIDSINAEIAVLNDRYNQALSHFRDDEPPGE